MHSALLGQVTAALAEFSSVSRLYELSIGESAAGGLSQHLLVEAFSASDTVHGIGARDVIVRSTSVRIELDAFPGQPAPLHASLSDGTRTCFASDISEVAQLGSDGGLARDHLRIAPWMWRLGQVRNSQ